MKKILISICAILFAAACLPGLPDLPEILTLNSVRLPVVAEEEIIWDVEDYQDKPVLIVFMGSWCPWCKKTMPSVTILKEKYGDKVEIIGAFMDKDPEVVQQVMEANGFTGKAVYDAGDLAEGLGVEGLPHTILFNKKHQSVKVLEGYRPDMAEVMSAEIDKLVK